MTMVNSHGLGAMSGATPTTSQQLTPSFWRIGTLERLREHPQWATELKPFTLQPYLCALYSLDPTRNPEATEVVRKSRRAIDP
jgi:hypothetical protein